MQNSKLINNKVSEKTKTIITIILLLFTCIFFPLGLIGFILMWFWTKWNKWVKILISLIFVLIFISISFFITYLFFFRPFELTGNSMNPNYKSGELVLSKLFYPESDLLNRTEVVIFKSPTNPDSYLFQRVIGLPKETIMIKNQSVYINGQQLDESNYLLSGTTTYEGTFFKEGEEKLIPADSVVVMGDNRNFSLDSRKLGFIKKSDVIAKLFFCYANCKK